MTYPRTNDDESHYGNHAPPTRSPLLGTVPLYSALMRLSLSSVPRCMHCLLLVSGSNRAFTANGWPATFYPKGLPEREYLTDRPNRSGNQLILERIEVAGRQDRSLKSLGWSNLTSFVVESLCQRRETRFKRSANNLSKYPIQPANLYKSHVHGCGSSIKFGDAEGLFIDCADRGKCPQDSMVTRTCDRGRMQPGADPAASPFR